MVGFQFGQSIYKNKLPMADFATIFIMIILYAEDDGGGSHQKLGFICDTTGNPRNFSFRDKNVLQVANLRFKPPSTFVTKGF